MFEFEPGVAFWTIMTFGIVLWIIQSKVYPPVRAVLDARREKIRKDLEEAAHNNQQAALVSKELTEKLQAIRLEEQRILSEARDTARVFYEQQVKVVSDEIKEIRKQKEQDLGHMEHAFFENSEQKFAKLIIAGCEKILKTSLTPEQQQAVIAERIRELEKITDL